MNNDNIRQTQRGEHPDIHLKQSEKELVSSASLSHHLRDQPT